MAAKRYQGSYQFRPGQNPYQYAEGIRSPAPPRLTAPPSAPNLRRPRITPAEATMRGEAALGSQLTKMLDSWADVAYNHATEEAKIEGKKAGLRAGLGQVDAPELRGDNTFYGQAYDEGALLAHQSAVQNDIRKKVMSLEIEHTHDPVVFKKMIEAYRSGTLSEISEDLKLWANEEINNYSSRSLLRIENNFQTRKKRAETAEITEAAQGFIKVAVAAAWAGDLVMTVDQLNQLEMLTNSAVNTGHMDPVAVQEKMSEVMVTAKVQQELGEFQRALHNKGLDAAEELYKKQQEETPEDVEVHKLVLSGMGSMIGKERTRVSQQRARENAERTALEKQLQEDVRDAKDALDLGYTPKNLSMVVDLVRGTKFEQELNRSIVTHEAVKAFRLLPFDAQETEISRLTSSGKSEGLSGQQAKLLERFERVHNEIDSALNKGEGLNQAVKDGLLSEVIPLNTSSSDHLTQSLRQRDRQAMIAESKYQRPVSRLTPAEVIKFIEQMAGMDTDEKVAFFGVLVGGLGKHSEGVLELFNKKGAKAFSMAGHLWLVAPDIAEEIVRGQDLVGTDLMPAGSKIRPVIYGELGGAYDADQDGAHREAIISAVSALYARRAYLADEPISDEIDEDILRNAIEDVTGGILSREWTGAAGWDPTYNIPAPERYMDQDAFEDWIDRLTVLDIRAGGGVLGAEPQDIIDQVKDGKLKLIYVEDPVWGPGYNLIQHKGLYIANENGSPFLLRYQRAIDNEKRATQMLRNSKLNVKTSTLMSAIQIGLSE